MPNIKWEFPEYRDNSIVEPLADLQSGKLTQISCYRDTPTPIKCFISCEERDEDVYIFNIEFPKESMDYSREVTFNELYQLLTDFSNGDDFSIIREQWCQGIIFSGWRLFLLLIATLGLVTSAIIILVY